MCWSYLHRDDDVGNCVAGSYSPSWAAALAEFAGRLAAAADTAPTD